MLPQIKRLYLEYAAFVANMIIPACNNTLELASVAGKRLFLFC